MLFIMGPQLYQRGLSRVVRYVTSIINGGEADVPLHLSAYVIRPICICRGTNTSVFGLVINIDLGGNLGKMGLSDVTHSDWCCRFVSVSRCLLKSILFSKALKSLGIKRAYVTGSSRMDLGQMLIIIRTYDGAPLARWRSLG